MIRLPNLSVLPLDGSTWPTLFCPVRLSSKNELKRVFDFGLDQSDSDEHTSRIHISGTPPQKRWGGLTSEKVGEWMIALPQKSQLHSLS